MDGESKELYGLIRSDIIRVESTINALSLVVAGFNATNQEAVLSAVQRLVALETKVASHDRLLWMLGAGLVSTMVGVAVNLIRILFLH